MLPFKKERKKRNENGKLGARQLKLLCGLLAQKPVDFNSVIYIFLTNMPRNQRDGKPPADMM